MSLEINYRTYGQPPYKIAVLHGGPGAPGYMAPVARELSNLTGVLEPLQTKDSLDGQIAELNRQLTNLSDTPVTLIASSWGVILALFLAAEHNSIVQKLILIGSAVFDAASSAKITPLRLSRLSETERRQYDTIMLQLENAPSQERNELMKQWGRLLDGTDMYDPISTDTEIIEVQYELYAKVWSDFIALRDRPDYLKNKFSEIKLPVTIIHGEFDPHPIDGIRPFLESCLTDTHFYILPKCGHYPWLERHAKERFYDILGKEI